MPGPHTQSRVGWLKNPHGHSCVEFWNFSLLVRKPVPYELPVELKSLGDHIRTERLKRGLSQQEVAKLIGVTEAAISNWERNNTKPRIRFVPKIIEFLRYDPHPVTGNDLASKVSRYQRTTGLSIPKIAQLIGIDASYLGQVLKGKYQLSYKWKIRLKQFLKEHSTK